MLKIAVYGKGGIGKSTTVSNMAVALAEKGLSVMQIGCDPKADSTIALRDGEPMPAVLDIYNEKKGNVTLEEITRIGYKGVVCVESGGPTPGLGCAGRGIITALEKLKETGAYEVYKPDVVLYEEGLDDNVVEGAVQAIKNADMLIIGGTSLVVYPAAGFIRDFTGKNLAMINKTQTQADEMANLVIHQGLGSVFEQIK